MRRMIVPCLAFIIMSPLARSAEPALSPIDRKAPQGVDISQIDRKAQPCTDMFAFANGTWRAAHPIPAYMDRWSPRWESGETNTEHVRELLEVLSGKPQQAKGSSSQLAGDFFAACTNRQARDQAGLTPLAALLAKVAAIQDVASLQDAIDELQMDGVQAPVPVGSQPDLHDPKNVIADVSAGGLGLPDRDYYLKPDARFVAARGGYLAQVAAILKLAGATDAQAAQDAQTVMTFETALAKVSLDNVALRDPTATDHKMTLPQLKALTPHFNWDTFYKAAAIPVTDVNVEQPAFLQEVDRQLATTPLATWRVYLRWQLLNTFASSLSTPFVDQHFAFYQQQLAGVKVQKPPATICAQQTDAQLGEALGREYVRRYFPPAAKTRARQMIANIVAVMHDTIEGLDWMAPQTKTSALQKLTTLNVKVGYPDKWKDYRGVSVARGNYVADVLSTLRYQVADSFSQVGKPIDRSRWGMTPPTSNAYYDATKNEIVFPAGILQPPAFSIGYIDAVNYGAIGVVMGHELSHAFDDQGSQFDAQGQLRNWWTPEDRKRFDLRTACVAHQFDGYTVDGGLHINGKLVLGESIADLGGVKLSYLAFHKALKDSGAGNTLVDGFTQDQQFFLSWAQWRGDETRPETQRLMVQGDPHPIAKYRVIGPFSNFAPFAKAFQCSNDAAMVRAAADRCSVW